MKYALIAAGLFASCVSTAASANISWVWSFAGETGTFVTDGSLVAGVAQPGTYTLIDFAVTGSSVGGTIGSLSGGDYVVDVFGTSFPYTMAWNGSAVTFWGSDGFNTFDWWAFGDQAVEDGYYFFAWDLGNINDPTKAGYYLGDEFNPPAVGTVTVRVADTPVIPEPATWALMITGFGLVGVAARSRRRAAAGDHRI